VSGFIKAEPENHREETAKGISVNPKTVKCSRELISTFSRNGMQILLEGVGFVFSAHELKQVAKALYPWDRSGPGNHITLFRVKLISEVR